MKVKMKLDLASIKGWMLEHGEKLGLGVVAVVFLLFAYYAIQREVLPAANQPGKLDDLATSVAQHVTSSRWDEERVGVQVVDYSERAQSKLVKASDFAIVKPFNAPVMDQKPARDVPPVLNAEDLRVYGGFDIFMFKDGEAPAGPGGRTGGAVKPQAQPWAVVTGLVPVERQKEEFDRAYAHAIGADTKRDVPQYAFPVLERTEIDEANPDKFDWKLVTYAREYEDKWANAGEEIISAKYVDPDLTGRLGQLVNEGKWGESVTHPKVPLAADEGEPNNPAAAAVEAQPAEPKDDGANDQGQFQFSGAKPGGKRPPAAADSKVPNQDKVVMYRLLRAFDYSVEPGKKYRYRVKIGLRNPSFGLPPQYLKDPKSARTEHLSGEPSKATPVVTIPDGRSVLAGAVDPGSRFTEPSAKLLVKAIDREQGLETSAELPKVFRGTIANSEKSDFHSNILVLDIYGGKTLPGRRRIPPITAPGELLLLDANGNMMVRNELDDESQYGSSLVPVEPEAKKAKNPLNRPAGR